MEDHNESIQLNVTVAMEELYCPNLTEDGKYLFTGMLFYKTNETRFEIHNSIHKLLDFKILMDYSYWVEGVFLIGTAFLGILWNLIAIYILVTREPMRKLMFNQLLISLLFFDNMFVFLSILDR